MNDMEFYQQLREQPSLLAEIEDQDDVMCSIAIGANPHAIRYVKNQKSFLCYAALEQDVSAIRDIRNQLPEYKQYIIQQKRYPTAVKWFLEITEEDAVMAVSVNADTLGILKNHSFRICMAALRKSVKAFRFCRFQNEYMCAYVVERDPKQFYLVKHQTKKVCMLAVRDPEQLALVEDQDYEICYAAASKDLKVLWMIRNDSLRERVKADLDAMSVVGESEVSVEKE